MQKQSVLTIVLLFCVVYLSSSAPAKCVRAANILELDDSEQVLFFDQIKKEINQHVGNTDNNDIKKAIDQVAKKVSNNIKNGLKDAKEIVKKVADNKIVEKVIKQAGGTAAGIKKAIVVLDKLTKELSKEKGTYQQSNCHDKPVCQYDCSKVMNCPVKDTMGFMDLTERIKNNRDEQNAYNWVCKNSFFSSSSQKDNTLSKYFRKLIGKITKKTDAQFIQEHPNASETQFDNEYLAWLNKKGIHSSERTVFEILNYYKDGIQGFEKICKEKNPGWLTSNVISTKLAQFELESLKTAVFGTKAEQESDAVAAAFRKVGEWKMDYLKGITKSEEDTYANALFKGLSLTFRKYFISTVIGGSQRDFCVCRDYNRFFDAMKKLPEGTRKATYGISNIAFGNDYQHKLQAVCQKVCSVKEVPKVEKPKPQPKKEVPKVDAPKEETKKEEPKKEVKKDNMVAPKTKECLPGFQKRGTRCYKIGGKRSFRKVKKSIKKVRKSRKGRRWIWRFGKKIFDVEKVPNSQKPTRYDVRNIIRRR
eukprot:gene3657-6473_t